MDDVGLAMVVHDTRDNVKRAIDSVKDIVSEILIVDQGSPEDLSDLCNVYLRTTKKGFGDPDKQWACSNINTPWIITLESDEYFSEEARQVLPELLNDTLDVYWFKFINLCDGVNLSQLLGDDYHPRLHRKGVILHDVSHAHSYPNIQSTRQAFVDKEVVHDRTYDKVISSHAARHHLLPPEEQQLENNFLSALDRLLKTSKANGSNISR